MSEEAQKKALELLATLASKLGTTTEKLWGVLVAQSRVILVSDTIWIILSVVVFLYGLKLATKFTEMDDWLDWEPKQCATTFVGAGMVAISVIVFSCCITEWVTALLNPEFLAVEKIMEMIK